MKVFAAGLLCAMSCGCSALIARAPTPQGWAAAERGVYQRETGCHPAGAVVYLDAAAAAVSAVSGVGFLALGRNADSARFLLLPLGALANAAAYGWSAYHGVQVNQECDRYDAVLKAALEKSQSPATRLP